MSNFTKIGYNSRHKSAEIFYEYLEQENIAKKKLTLKGITFPDFGDDDSKKNFRLVFYIGYTDADGNEAVEVVSKPSERHWQWRNQNKDAYLKPTVKGDSVKLDTLVLRNGDGEKIEKGSNVIAEIDGEITDITVQFMDVHDKTVADFLVKNILPELHRFRAA